MSTSIAPTQGGPEQVRELARDLAPGQVFGAPGDVVIRGAVDRGEVTAGGRISVAGRAGGATLNACGDITLDRAHSCVISGAAGLHFLGSGASDCDIAVAGDLTATADGSSIRSGLLAVGGRLRVREIAGRESSCLRIVMAERRETRDLVWADVVQAGVEIVVCGELLRFDRRHLDVHIDVVGLRAVVRSV